MAKRRRDFFLGCVSSLVMEWWRRWSGSMARRASARLAARLRCSAGGMLASKGSCLTGEGCKRPIIIRRVQLRLTSNRLVCLLLLHVGANYSVGAYTCARAEVRSVDGLAPIPYQQVYGWVHYLPWPYLLCSQWVHWTRRPQESSKIRCHLGVESWGV